MTFYPGDSKPEASGRKKGTRNKRSLKIAEELQSLGFDVMNEFISIYNASDNDGKRAMLLKLMDFTYPKLKAYDLSFADKPAVKTIEEVLRDAKLQTSDTVPKTSVNGTFEN